LANVNDADEEDVDEFVDDKDDVEDDDDEDDSTLNVSSFSYTSNFKDSLDLLFND
jgi:hypothetical protein